MPLSRNIEKGKFRTFSIATVPAILVLSSLLVAQNVPLKFTPAASVRQCVIGVASAQCQTQRFDSDGAQWIAPVVVIAILPSAVRPNRTFTQARHPAIQIEGFQFNRPPPTT